MKEKLELVRKEALAALGVKVIAELEYSEEFETGKVISMTPTAGSEVAKDSTVKLIVSRGKEIKKVKVPNWASLGLRMF